MEIFEAIRIFKKVNWQDIPDQGLYSTQLIAYINENLIAFFPDMVSLSPSMINNYVKADIVPKPIKKKYYREHIATLMVVVILKELIRLESIKEGIGLQLEIMGIERAYNQFMDILEKSLKDLIRSLQSENKIYFEGFEASWENISLTIAIKAFSFQTVTREILKLRGIYPKGAVSKHESVARQLLFLCSNGK